MEGPLADPHRVSGQRSPGKMFRNILSVTARHRRHVHHCLLSQVGPDLDIQMTYLCFAAGEIYTR